MSKQSFGLTDAVPQEFILQELVKEKIQGQELHNELDQLHQELEHIGINRQKLVRAEQSHDEK